MYFKNYEIRIKELNHLHVIFLKFNFQNKSFIKYFIVEDNSC
jgi:hypothetical protein